MKPAIEQEDDEYVGQSFENWTVLYVSPSKKNHLTCKCSCGTIRDVSKNSLKLGRSGGCGLCRTGHKKIEVGDVFTSNQGCEFVVLEYNGAFNVVVKFLDSAGHTKQVCTGEIRSGEVGNPFFPSVLGVGYPGIDKNSKDGYKLGKTREHMFWKGMMERCYSEKSLQRSPTYKGCSVDVCWHNFQNFAEWCYSQKFFNFKDDNGRSYQLDKDILVKGNKVYSPETCCFVPHEINSLFLLRKSLRGEYPIGVSYNKQNRKFDMCLTHLGKKLSRSLHETPEEAFKAYKEAKELCIKEIAEKWKDKLDAKVYKSLLRYEVDMCD